MKKRLDRAVGSRTLMLFILLCGAAVWCTPVTPAAHADPGVYVFDTLWPRLSQPWYFSWPKGIDLSPDGKFVYFCENYNHRIGKMTRDGVVVAFWGTRGSEDGRFESPHGIAVTPDGFVYVSDAGNHRIQKFDTNGNHLLSWGSSGSGDGMLDTPAGIDVDANGYVYVADKNNDRIVKFDAYGRFVSKWESYTRNGITYGFNQPQGIAAGPDGYIYVADSRDNEILRFSRDGVLDGTWLVTGTTFFYPYGIDVDVDGNVFVADSANGMIKKISPQGVFIGSVGATGREIGQFNFPADLAADRDGFLFVADTQNNRVQKFTDQLAFLENWGSRGNREGFFSYPQGIAIQQTGADDAYYVYVADTYNRRIQKFDQDGVFQGVIPDPEGAATPPDKPVGVAVDSAGRIYVSDWSADGQHRIRIYAADGMSEAAGSPWEGADLQLAGATWPTGIHIDDNDKVFVTFQKNGRIVKYTADGTSAEVVVEGPYIWIADAVTDETGHLYFVDAWGGKVYRYDAEADPAVTEIPLGTPLNQAFGIDLDPDGNLAVADTGNQRIVLFSTTGTRIASIGDPDGLSGFSPGLFNNPYGIAVGPDARILVSELDNNRISAFVKSAVPTPHKAVIVPGGGRSSGNRLWDATSRSTVFAYKVLLQQGFSKENVYLLYPDPDTDFDGNQKPDDVDSAVSLADLQYAVTQWGADAQVLHVYLVDHGGDRTFRMNESEVLQAADLDAWLDQVQAGSGPLVSLIYDACRAGSFAPDLTPPTGSQRVFIAGAGPEENAWFPNKGSISFSSFFWSEIFNGRNIYEAFNSARAATGVTLLQTPVIDANGDGLTDDQDLSLAETLAALPDSLSIGRGRNNFIQAPIIGSVTLEGSAATGLTIAAGSVQDPDNGGLAEVWAEIRPPVSGTLDSTISIRELPSVTLAPGLSGYEGVFDRFSAPGNYEVSVYARDTAGNVSAPKRLSTALGDPPVHKALIIATGEGDEWANVEKAALLALNVLTYDGYGKEDIALFASTPIGDWKADAPTLSGIADTLTDWAGEPLESVLVYLVGEGGAAGGLVINADEILLRGDGGSAENLDGLLDTLQLATGARALVLCDVRYAGAWLVPLASGGAYERIVIAGSSNRELAGFRDAPPFSFHFWREIMGGSSVWDAFLASEYALRSIFPDQKPLLDDNGNGLGNEPGQDGAVARNRFLGAGVGFAKSDPLVGRNADRTLIEGSTDVIEVSGVGSNTAIRRVWAVITPPGVAEDTILAHLRPRPVVELQVDGPGRWSASYDGFTVFGVYNIAIFALDQNEEVSSPASYTLFRTDAPDPWENDDSSDETAPLLVINDDLPQLRNFHTAQDVDHVRFFGVQGVTYLVRTGDPGPGCSARIELLNEAGDLLEFTDGNRTLEWTCPSDGLYFVRLSNDAAGVGGNAAYTLSIATKTSAGAFAGFLVGSVQTAAGSPIGGASIRSDAGASAVTLPDGLFFMIHPPGDGNTIIAEKAGYGSVQKTGVDIAEGGVVALELKISSNLDPDGDGLGNDADNCDFAYNPGQEDRDGDSVGDLCDACPDDGYKSAPGVCGCGVTDRDSDNDNVADCRDDCPADPAKTAPGTCGCGVPDTDTDGDGEPECRDGCPDDPLKMAPGICGCGVPDTDTDGDGQPDCRDQCPGDPLKTAPGVCGCGLLDDDADGDGAPACRDECPGDPAKSAPGICGCGVADTDTDGDGVRDCRDECPDDPGKTEPGVCGCKAPDVDTDQDGEFDCTDFDDDGDGMPDAWETGYGLDPLLDDSGDDPDRDGVPNIEEYRLGTDPFEPAEIEAPDPPELVSPANGASAASLTPVLAINRFDLSAHYFALVEWQVSPDFNFNGTVFEKRTPAGQNTLAVPNFVLSGETRYYWRARFYIDFSKRSEWAKSTFTTQPDTNQYEDGIDCEDRADDDVDLNRDGIPDNEQTGVIKSVKGARQGVNLGVQPRASDTQQLTPVVSSIKCDPYSPDNYENLENAPVEMPFGVLAFSLDMGNSLAGDPAEITVRFSEPAPEGYTWWKYDEGTGWYDYSDYATFSPDRTFVTLLLWDGGPGDADGVMNGKIVDPSGLGPVPAGSSGSGDFIGIDSAMSSGGGCFIATAAYGDYDAPNVRILRVFRDRFLKPSPIGRFFIRLYYRYSPELARRISGNESMRAVVRLLLTPLVWTAQILIVAGLPGAALLCFCMTLLMLSTLRSVLKRMRCNARFPSG